MSRQYEKVEPSVIDSNMLEEAVEEQGPKDEARNIAKREGFRFGDVLSLRLDFRNILHIDNLWEFTSLTKLQLDNNIIEKIEGLDLLVNLVWLDLSFNNIEVIEGLNALTKLRDLTLYNNRISKIENLDAQQELQVFSIGNNDIKDTKDIIYLRRFSNLKTLNIGNNPICTQENYRLFVIAFLPKLQFLDYQLLDHNLKSKASEIFLEKVQEQDELDKEARQLQDVKLQQEKDLKLHKEAFVEYLNTDKLFLEMYANDHDGQKLNEMPGADEIVSQYKEKFLEICKRLFVFGLQENEKRREEANMFWNCVNEAKVENKAMAMAAIHEYMKDKHKLFASLQTLSDAKLMENKLKEFYTYVTSLSDRLMVLELQLVDQLEEVIKEFERNMQDLVSNFLENMHSCLTEMREQENINNERITECASNVLDKASKNELEDITEELKMLLVDKDTAMSAITSSHDSHILKIDNQEDYMSTGIRTWLKNLMDTIHKNEEIDRNRLRVTEIIHLKHYLQDELDDLEVLHGVEDGWCMGLAGISYCTRVPLLDQMAAVAGIDILGQSSFSPSGGGQVMFTNLPTGIMSASPDHQSSTNNYQIGGIHSMGHLDRVDSPSEGGSNQIGGPSSNEDTTHLAVYNDRRMVTSY